VEQEEVASWKPREVQEVKGQECQMLREVK
jgi:hypothetical protein